MIPQTMNELISIIQQSRGFISLKMNSVEDDSLSFAIGVQRVWNLSIIG